MKQLLPIKRLVAVAIISLLLVFNAKAQPFVEMIQPNDAGISWTIGQTYLISWNTNFTQPVKLELVDYTDLNNLVTTTIIASTPNSTFAWNTTAFSPGTKYKVKVSSTINTSLFAVSDEYFSLTTTPSGQTIEVKQPSLPGITWIKGTANLISWVDNIPGNVLLELINDDLIAADNASYAGYAGGLWGHGTNGGYGFEPWNVEYTGGTDGVVGDPAAIGIIGMDNPSFYLAASFGVHIYTDRPFDSPLLVGSTFSFDWAVINDNGGTAGTKGIEIYSGYVNLASPGTKVIDIELGTGNTIYLNGSPMFLNAGAHVMTLNFEYTSATKLQVSGIGRDGSEVFDQEIIIAGAPDAIRFGVANMLDMDPSRRLYFNNFKITTPDKVIATNVEGSTYPWTIGMDIPAGNKFKIRVSSMLDETTLDVSDNYFSIAATASGTVEMIQPNEAGIIWLRGSEYLISWTDNLNENVKIELVKGGSVVSTIAASVAGSTYSWSIPIGTTLGTDYKIKVTSTANASYSDISANNFEIADYLPGGGITVIQPSVAGISWLRGSTYLISWEDNITEPVNIELVNYSNAVVTPIASNVVGSTYAWSIPAPTPLGTQYKVRIKSTVFPLTVLDESNFNFAIVATPGGTIDVLQPDVSGITWLRGQSYLISWIDNIPETVNVDLYKGGFFYASIGSNVEGSTMIWEIPIGTALGSDYQVRVYSTIDNLITNLSLHNFSIADYLPGGGIEVIQPNGGEYWLRGNSYFISWLDDIADPVNIEVENLTTLTVTPIGTNVVGSTMVWDIPSGFTLGNNYIVRIKSSVNALVYDESDLPFEIAETPGGSIDVIQPNGGELWYLGSAYLISWIDEVPEPMDVYLVKDSDGGFAHLIASDVVGSTTVWTIPSNPLVIVPASDYRVKVVSSLNSLNFDLSDATFTIAAMPLNVFPNPASTSFTVELDADAQGTITLALTNRFGLSVINRTINASESNLIEINAAELPNGVYFLKVTSGNTTLTRKVLIQH